MHLQDASYVGVLYADWITDELRKQASERLARNARPNYRRRVLQTATACLLTLAVGCLRTLPG